MEENLISQVFEISKHCKKISPFFLMRKFKINYECAVKICNKISLRNHLEAKELAKKWNENIVD